MGVEWKARRSVTSHYHSLVGSPGGTVGKESACQYRRCKRCGFIPWIRKILWRRKWQPILVFLPGKLHGQRSLVGYNPWGCPESDMSVQLSAYACTHTHRCTHTHAHAHTHTHTHPVVWTVEDCVQVGGKADSGLDSSPIIGKCCGLVSSRNSEAQLLHLHYGIKKNHLNQFGTQGFLHQQRVR